MLFYFKNNFILHHDEDKQQYEQFPFDQDEDENNYFHDLLLNQYP